MELQHCELAGCITETEKALLTVEEGWVHHHDSIPVPGFGSVGATRQCRVVSKGQSLAMLCLTIVHSK